jgi:hypothetical protein
MLHYNTCEPSCADGKAATKQVQLEFRRVRMHHGAPTFTELRYGTDDYWTPLTPPDHQLGCHGLFREAMVRVTA